MNTNVRHLVASPMVLADKAASVSALARLLDASSANALRDTGWPHRHHAVHAALERLPPPLLRLHQEGIAALFDRYRGSLSFGRGARTVQAIDGDGHPAHLFTMGLTVYLHDIAPWLPGAAGLLSQIEREFGVPAGSARMTVFASPSGDGLPLHFDGEDVISVQLVGRKRFVVAPVEGLVFPVGAQFVPGMPVDDRLYAQCAEGFPASAPEDAVVVDMQPGSVLLLPRGTWHRTEAVEDSLAVSLVLRPPVAADALLAQLAPLLLQDPRWRTPLYGAAGSGQDRHALKGLMDSLLGELPELVGRLSGQALMRQANPLANASVDDASRLQAVPTARLSIAARGGGWWLRVSVPDDAGIERLTLDREVGVALVPLLQWLARHRAAFGVDALDGPFAAIPRDDRLRVLQGLQEAGYLKPLGFVLR